MRKSYYPHDNTSTSNVSTLGCLYNWPAVMHGASSSSSNPSGVQGICPNGWHVSSDAEWTQLTNYVRSQPQYLCNGNSANIAKALASTTGWSNSTTPCAVGNNPHSNNATGFTIYNAGNYGSEYPNPYGGASFWSTTWYNGDGVGYHSLGVYSTDLNWYFVESIERWNNGSDYYKVTYDYSYGGQYPVSYRKSYYEVWEGGNYTGYSGMTEYEYVK